MRVRRFARSAVLLVPLMLVCAGRLHAHGGTSPAGMTQELNRCLTLIRAAASRRRQTDEHRQRVPQARRDTGTFAVAVSP